MRTSKVSISNDTAIGGGYINDNDMYPVFLEVVRKTFQKSLSKGQKLFTTNATGLFDAYLNNLPEEAQQHYKCRTCRHTIERFGGLVVQSDKGIIKSALWNEKDVPEFFKKSVKAMKEIVTKSEIDGVFISETAELGQATSGGWTHLAVTLPSEYVYKARLKNADQLMAEKLEDLRILKDSLSDYTIETVEQALNLLETEALYRSEKCLGVAKWLHELKTKISSTKNNKQKQNIMWLAVATAPEGFCHIRSSMIGTLLDDIASGMSFELVSSRFAKKMNPLIYQRPQAAPSAGNVAQAEKDVEKLGIKLSLVRRFARLDEINTVWKPKKKRKATKSTGDGVFSHLETKGTTKKATTSMSTPPITMTWEKFNRTVVPFAESIEYLVGSRDANYSAILTAEHQDAPPIILWDTEEKRNPFSHYVYSGGSSYRNWGLSLGYCKVTGICYQPSMWYGEYPNQSKSVMFILEGAKDSRYERAGCALFPEILKSELRGIRSTLEAYSRSSAIKGYDEASACGIRLQYGARHDWDTVFRVTTKTGTATYKLDRWD